MDLNTLVAWNHEGKGVLGRHSRKWQDSTKVDVMEIGLLRVDWIHLA
jgi:hypothetical protein